MPRRKKIKQKPNKKGGLLIVAGLLLLLAAGYFKAYSKQTLSFDGNIQSQSESGYSAKITDISIEGLGIFLKVSESQIVNGVWQVSSDGASHLNTSSNPSAGGNIVIYAHNKSNLFGKLPRIRQGDIVKLVTENSETFDYVVESTNTVTPDKIDYVLPTSEEKLTLYTCVGFMDSKRFIVQAKPI